MKRILLLSGILLWVAFWQFNCSSGSSEAQLTGESAFDYIRKDRSAAPKTDVQSIREVMDWAVEDYAARKRAQAGGLLPKMAKERVEPSENVMEILRKTTKPRKNLKPGDFERLDFSAFADNSPEAKRRARESENINLADLEDEFYVDNLDAIPVRNQGYRGTCAAFTGTGHIEYAALKQYSNLSTLDLSEQRFYYLSKPECQSSGCGLDEEGSWYGTGMEESIDASGPDIPLETDCPYNSRAGRNDVQTPQLDSCATGAVQVKRLEYVTGPKEIVDALHETKLPVPFASPLSGNWEQNSGLITLADSNYSGSTSHAAGHAYLIVGYKKLSGMADEGGMCFVIKNSWGTGWGVNGFSCMTLEWVKKWTFGYQLTHPMAMEVLLREDLREAEELPNNDEAEDETTPDVPDESEENDDANTDKTDDEVEDEIDILPEPDPEEDLNWKAAKLFGPGESYYRAEYAEDGDAVFVRATLREKSSFTNPVELTKDPKKTGVLVYDGDRVGKIAGEELYVCSGGYDYICSLRFSTEENQIYIEFPYADNRRVQEDDLPDGSWSTFDIPFGDFGFDIYQPEDLTSLVTDPKAFLRMKKSNGSKTDPIRLTMDGTDVKAMGEPVGSLNPSNLGLCTGSFSDACGIFSLGEELNILPSW
ncbi:MAG: hypothetical protein C4523_20520 [Myxococcales bacterium]|nr:MAG: hypothetical protein C4523_20520 [Myxococcales bacterium]